MVGPQVVVRLAQVAPVAVVPVREGAAAVDQAREQVVAEVTQPGVALFCAGAELAVQLLQHLAQHGRVVGDHLGHDRARRGLVGLVGERGDPAVVVDLDDAVVTGIVALG